MIFIVQIGSSFEICHMTNVLVKTDSEFFRKILEHHNAHMRYDFISDDITISFRYFECLSLDYRFNKFVLSNMSYGQFIEHISQIKVRALENFGFFNLLKTKLQHDMKNPHSYIREKSKNFLFITDP